MPPPPQSRRWVFTLNNPVEGERMRISNVLSSNDVAYGIQAREVGESGTPHIQGFVIFIRPRRFRAVKLLIGNRTHVEPARGTSQQARDYCKKDGDYDEYGSFPDEQGRRTDIEDVLQWAKQFEQDNGRPPTSPDVAKEHPSHYLKHPRLMRLIQLRSDPILFETNSELRDWQRDLEVILDGEADDRKINFVVDATGNKGKTWFCRYYMSKHPNRVQLLGVGKRDDVAHMVDETRSVFLFNVSRDQMDHFQYPVLEMLKDRLVMSHKYNSRMKVFRSNVHVVVMCNEMPDMNKLSMDRYNIIDI